MAWIHCGLDSLWFGLIVAWLVLQICSVDFCSMFNCPNVQLSFLFNNIFSIAHSSIGILFNGLEVQKVAVSTDFSSLILLPPALLNQSSLPKCTGSNDNEPVGFVDKPVGV